MPGRIPLTSLICVLLAASLSGAAWGEPRRWTPLPGKSQVAFDASFPLGDFSGRTEDVSGEFQADMADLKQGVTGFLEVKAASLRTGVDGRDRDLRAALEVDRHPTMRYLVQRVEASFPTLSDRADVLLTIEGLLLIRGVERPVPFPGRVRLREDRLWVRGEARIRMSDFGIRPPRRLFFEVRDAVLLTFDLLLAQDK